MGVGSRIVKPAFSQLTKKLSFEVDNKKQNTGRNNFYCKTSTVLPACFADTPFPPPPDPKLFRLRIFQSSPATTMLLLFVLLFSLRYFFQKHAPHNVAL